jgi:hypothetical protein
MALVEIRDLKRPIVSGLLFAGAKREVVPWMGSLDISAGETLGLVGEPAWQEIPGWLVLRLIETTSGSVHSDGPTC